MKLNNCLFFAVLEAIRTGKYVVIRKSKHDFIWPFFHCHFLVIQKKIVDEYAKSYMPVKDDLGNFPWPFFRGKIKKGDK